MFDETRSTLSSHAQTTVHGPVESPGTDGFAITSFFCGLFGLVPFGALFGVLALVRITRTGRAGRGLAIAGLVLSVLWLGFGVAKLVPKLVHQAAGGPGYVHTMGLGGCFDAGRDGEHVTPRSCEQPHDEQIFGRVEVGAGSAAYPGLPAIREPALTACRASATAYFTEGTPPPAIEFMAHLPTEGSWTGGVHTATCTFRQPSGKLTAFVRP